MNTSALKSSEYDHLLEVFISLLLELGGGTRDVTTARRRFASEGVSFLSKTLPLLGKALYRGLSDRRFKLPTNFKTVSRRSQIPCFLQVFFRVIISEDGTVLENSPQQIEAILRLNQLCMLFYKYEFPIQDSDRDKAIDKFCATDDEVQEFIPDSSSIIARDITTRVFGGLSLSDFDRPAHGPGVVSNFSKNKEEFIPLYRSNCVSHFGEQFFTQPDEYKRIVNIRLACGIASFLGVDFGEPNYYKPVAKGIVVPKDSRGGRYISAEPLEHMYAQKSISRRMTSIMENHPISKGHVNFSDQTINQDLVVRHSIDRKFSTLDLKDASDLVSLEVVKYYFGDCSELLEAMLACRSEYTLLEKSEASFVRHLRKFAPMGSDLCFRVLSWVVYVTLISALIDEGFSLREAKKNVFVYGDDVVVRTSLASTCVTSLTRIGLRINEDKSFIDSNFLESCGADSYNGFRIEPIRAKLILHPRSDARFRTSLNSSDLVRHVEKTVSLANNLRDRGFHITANLLFARVEKATNSPLPYGTSRSPYLNKNCNSSYDAWICNSAENLERICRNRGLPSIRCIVSRPSTRRYFQTAYGRLRRFFLSGRSAVHSDIYDIDELQLLPWGEYSVPKNNTLKWKKMARDFSSCYSS